MFFIFIISKHQRICLDNTSKNLSLLLLQRGDGDRREKKREGNEKGVNFVAQHNH